MSIEDTSGVKEDEEFQIHEVSSKDKKAILEKWNRSFNPILEEVRGLPKFSRNILLDGDSSMMLVILESIYKKAIAQAMFEYQTRQADVFSKYQISYSHEILLHKDEKKDLILIPRILCKWPEDMVKEDRDTILLEALCTREKPNDFDTAMIEEINIRRCVCGQAEQVIASIPDKLRIQVIKEWRNVFARNKPSLMTSKEADNYCAETLLFGKPSHKSGVFSLPRNIWVQYIIYEYMVGEQEAYRILLHEAHHAQVLQEHGVDYAYRIICGKADNGDIHMHPAICPQWADTLTENERCKIHLKMIENVEDPSWGDTRARELLLEKMNPGS